MKVRILVFSVVLLGLMGSLALGHGGTVLSPVRLNAALRSASDLVLPSLLGFPSPLAIAAGQQSLPPTGPQPVNLITAGSYLENGHTNGAGTVNGVFADFNGDGKQDLLVLDESKCLAVFPGNGTGQFTTPEIDSCVLPNTSSFLAAVGDLDGDGIPDVAVLGGTCCGANIYLMLAKGNGDGTFTYETSFSYSYYSNQLGYGEQPTGINFSDLNGDGKLDMVMTTSGGNANNYTTYIYLNTANFTFTPSQIAGRGSCPNASSSAIADLNHDGIPDIALTTDSCGLHEVDVMLGNGDGTFQTAVGYSSDTGSPNSLAIGDVNGDGNPDFVVIEGAGGNPITTFLGNGDGTFGNAIDSTSVYNPDFLAVGDFNGDGKADVVVSSDYSGGTFVGAQLSNGDGTFALPVQYNVVLNPARVIIGDANGDGHPDWVSFSQTFTTNYFTVGLGNGDGTILAGVANYSTPGVFNNGVTTYIVAADFNKDGHLDYATVGSDRNYPGMNIILGNGNGTFAAPVHYTAGSAPAYMAAADFNGDGYPDIAALDSSNSTVTVLLNNGDGTLGNGVGYSVGLGGGYILTGDFNRDGKMDIITSNPTDGTVSVLLGNGDGTFQPQKVSTALPSGFYLALGDFNRDGKLDVAVTYFNSSTTSNIDILLGNGDGTFQSPIVTTGLKQATGLATADFNKDGLVDLAVSAQSISNGSGGNSGVAIFLGLGNGSFQSSVSYPTIPDGLSGAIISSFPQLGDLNNDGNLDIVVPNYYTYASGMNVGPAILLGNGDGTFTLNPAHAALTGPNEAMVALGDFNGDGSLDVAVQNYDPGNGFDNTSSTVTMLLSTGGTEVVLTSAPNPSIQGNPVTFTATVVTSFHNLPTPTGTITFEYGSTNVPVTLVNGVATYVTSTLPIGRTLFHAAYSGDANYNPSTSMGLTQTVRPAPLKITTTSLPGAVQNVSYSATVAATGGTPPYTFSISSGNLPTGLSIDSSSGIISGTPTGLPATSNFTVKVQDVGSPMQTATANLSITVASNLQITTTTLPAGVVGNSYNATLAATGGIPPYSFTVTLGSLPAGLTLSASGVISGTPTGPAGTSNFTVQAKDSAIPAQMTTANLSITVSPGLSITTTSLPNAVQGSPYSATVVATGGIPPYTFSVTSGHLPRGLSLAANGVISGTPTSAGTSNFIVQAKDSSSPSQMATANLSITVNSSLKITTTSLPNGVVGNSYNATVTASGGIPPYTFTKTAGNLPAGLSLSTSGAITGTPTTQGTSNFTVKATDSANPVDTATANLSITVAGPLMITTTSLPNGLEASPYNATVAATGGVLPYNFTVSSGTLPIGLTMNSSGVISGTPTVPGTSNFTIQVTDSSNPIQTATANLSITILSNLMITTTSLPNGVVGNSYSATLAASGGNPPYMFSVTVGTLPVGLSLSSAGVISGTPTSSGTSSFTVQVKDSSNPVQMATAILSITINPPVMITTTSLPPGVFGVPYSATVTASGGTLPYTFTVTAGSLPSGLSMSASGAITGTPTGLGKSSFTVQVADSSNPVQKATAKLSITISNNLKITTTSLPNAVFMVPYHATIMATGGTLPYTFSLISGQLPFGLSLSTTGVISGKPTQPGETENFTVQVADSSNPVQKATANFSITVFNSLTITTTSLPNAIVGTFYSATIMASGGTPPYTFSLSPGFTDPPGLSLSSSGVLSGTPSSGSSGTYNFGVQVVDSGSLMASATVSLTVNGSLSITTTSLPQGLAGVPYSATITATGGVPPYTFTISSGNLPAGLSLSAAGIISGTPTGSGTSNFTVQAKDSSTPPQTAAAPLSIAIGPLAPVCAYVNDNAPGQNYAEGYRVGPGSATAHVGPYPTNGMALAGGGFYPGDSAAAREQQGDLYVSDSASANITHFRVNKSTCALTKDSTLYPSGDMSPGFDALAITPDGNTMFVGSVTDDRIYSHTIAANGSLGATSTEALLGNFPNDMEVSPDGRTLVVSISFSRQVCAYPISAGHLGTPNCQATDPNDVNLGISIDSASACVYASEGNGVNRATEIEALPLTGSVLGTPTSYIPFGPGGNSVSVLVSWDNKTIYAGDNDTAQITIGSIAPGCSLTYKTIISDGVAGTQAPTQLAQDKTANGYVVNGQQAFSGTPEMGIFEVNADGTLVPVGSGQFPLRNSTLPFSVVVVAAQ